MSKQLTRTALIVCIVVISYAVHSCAKKEQTAKLPLTDRPRPAILIAQAQFLYEEKDGKKVPKPGPALLTIKQKTKSGWHDTVIEDPQSNVFHKALIVEEGKGRSILTIGAMEAALKLWRVQSGAWHRTLLWNPAFGGTWDRLRDVEIGDVTGDGIKDIVLATHDQGVVAVGLKAASGWNVREIDREKGVFVHEVEIGDVDGDGKNEFFATPSQPNKAAGGPQPGSVVMFSWNGKEFIKQTVDALEKTHAKEILAADMDGDGTATLFSVIEAETRKSAQETVRVKPVIIRQYDFSGDAVTAETVTTIEDFQCRFLTAGDVDADGQTELIAAAMKSGLWMLKKAAQGWEARLIDKSSSGYEHATAIDDLDGDGTPEIYVAADDQGELRSYEWNGRDFTKSVLAPIPDNRITWNLTTGLF